MQVLEKVAKTVSDNFKVTVNFKGSQAFTDGKNITVPHFGEEVLAADETLKDALRGFVDHETGHVLFTDMQAFINVSKGGDKALTNLVNLIEDLRVERACCEKFNGMKKTISNTMNHLIDTDKLKMPSQLEALWIQGRREYGIEIPGECRRAEVEKAFGNDVLNKIAGLESTADAIEFARSVLDKKMFDKEEKGAPQDPDKDPGQSDEENDQGGEGEGQEQESGSGDDKDGQGEGQEKEPGSGDKEGQGQEPETSDDGDGSDEEDENKNQDGLGEAGDEDDSGNKEDKDGEEDNQKDSDEEDADAGGQGCNNDKTQSEGLTQQDFENIEDPMDTLKNSIERKSYAMRQDNYSYNVYDVSKDEIRVVPQAFDTYEYKVIKARLGKINAAKRKITTLFNSSQASKWVGGQERGKVNARVLASVPAGNKMVFKGKFQAQQKNTAVTFLMDFSGSMCGQSLRDEIDSAVLFLEAFEGTGIKTELLGYTTKKKTAVTGSEARGFSRTEALMTYVFKTFTEPLNAKVKKRISNYKTLSLCNNADGESLKIAHDRLMQRPEKRKVLIVLTDGAVAQHGSIAQGKMYLKKLAAKIEKAGKVELICVDLYSGRGRKFYKNYVEITEYSTTTLQEALFHQIKRILNKK